MWLSFEDIIAALPGNMILPRWRIHTLLARVVYFVSVRHAIFRKRSAASILTGDSLLLLAGALIAQM